MDRLTFLTAVIDKMWNEKIITISDKDKGKLTDEEKETIETYCLLLEEREELKERLENQN